jgi:mercuric ion binding protein
MRKYSILLLAALAPVAAVAAPPQTTVLDVQNMTCSLCPVTVKKALEQVPGVARADVDMDRKTATVMFDADKTSAAALANATTNAGYPATIHK